MNHAILILASIQLQFCCHFALLYLPPPRDCICSRDSLPGLHGIQTHRLFSPFPFKFCTQLFFQKKILNWILLIRLSVEFTIIVLFYTQTIYSIEQFWTSPVLPLYVLEFEPQNEKRLSGFLKIQEDLFSARTSGPMATLHQKWPFDKCQAKQQETRASTLE